MSSDFIDSARLNCDEIKNYCRLLNGRNCNEVGMGRASCWQTADVCVILPPGGYICRLALVLVCRLYPGWSVSSVGFSHLYQVCSLFFINAYSRLWLLKSLMYSRMPLTLAYHSRHQFVLFLVKSDWHNIVLDKWWYRWNQSQSGSIIVVCLICIVTYGSLLPHFSWSHFY